MKVSRSTISLGVTLLLFTGYTEVNMGHAAVSSGVHVGVHRHLHQPVYWGAPDDLRPNQSQFGHDSQRLKDQNNAFYGDSIQHPSNILVGGNDSVFEDPDKVNAYQNWIKGSIGQMNPADSGMTISFSGALQRNLWSFGRDSAYGYSPSWNNQNIEAHGWTTSSGNSRAEVLGQTYNHAFTPLLPKTVLRKQIEMHRERTRKTWGLNPDMSDQSKGFWPIELAFSRHYIDILKEFNYDWVMVPNSHIARTCPNYEAKALAAGLLLADPPNKADQLGPAVPDGQWYDNNRDTYGNAFPVPFAYQLHKAKYVNPETGAESIITVVPQCDYHGYQSGYAAVGWEDIDGKITQFNDPNQPSLVMLTNDGENFWGGGYSFWMEFAPNFINDAPNHGTKATTIQQFIDEHPAPTNDIIHVEDGSWLAADQGSPQFYRWLEPPRNINPATKDPQDANTFFDLENGWHVDMRNWAVLYAGINHCETAEQITIDGGGTVEAWLIEEPYQDDGTSNNPNSAEQAWHFLMWGFDSGFMYFGTGEDDEVKQTLASNEAINRAAPAIGDASADATPPTVFKPQRFPWNPGGKGRGQYLGGLQSGGGTVGYTTAPWSSDFYIWTLSYDVSGVSNTTLKIRVDADGTNPLNDNANETFAGGSGVGNWISIPMTKRILPSDDPTNDSGIDFFQLPTAMADYYWAKVTGYRNKLLDYYIESVDNKGNIQKSEIQHVYVEDDGSAPSPATFSPSPTDCTPLSVTYDANDGPLAAESPIFQQISFDDGSTWTSHAAAHSSGNIWTYTNTVPNDAPSATVWFENTAGSVSDSNSGSNWSTLITDCGNPSVASASPANPNGCEDITVTYFPNESPLEAAPSISILIGRDGFQNTITPNPVMTDNGDGSWSYTYDVLPGTELVDFIFHDGNVDAGARIWDNNFGADWQVAVSNCVDIIITNPANSIIVSATSSNYTVQGNANPNIIGNLTWSNSLTSATGSIPSGLNWSIFEWPLVVGTNTIIVSGETPSLLLPSDSDSASDAAYSDGWDNNDNGGTGWDGGWTLTTTGASAGHFHATAAGNTFLSIGTDGWGLWANSGDRSEAVRGFTPALNVGDRITLKMDNNYIENSSFVGFSLRNASGQDLFTLKFVGGDSNYTIDDQTMSRDTGVGYTSDGLDITFDLSGPGATQYDVSLGATTISGTLAVAVDQTISQVELFNNSAGNNEDHNFYVNDLQVLRVSGSEVQSLPISIVRPSAFVDTDGDLIDDDWETIHFGSLTNAHSNSDFDMDNASDRDEFRAGTQPTNAASLLRLEQISQPGAAPMVTWSSVGGKSYTLQYTYDLTAPNGGWQNGPQVTENSVSNGAETSHDLLDMNGMTNGHKIYRILLNP